MFRSRCVEVFSEIDLARVQVPVPVFVMSPEEITRTREVNTTQLNPTAIFGTPLRVDGDNAWHTAEFAYVTRPGNRNSRWAYTVLAG